MPTSTSNYSLLKPLVNNATDQDLWGGYLNDDMDSIDTLLRAGITIASQASQTSGFTADASISVKKLYPCDATGGAFSATIPAATTAGNGATVFIKKTDATANAITLARTGADTLDGATSLSLPAINDCYGLVSDGVSAWRSICRPSAVVPDASDTVKGIVELATAAETLGGSDAVRAITAAGFAGNKSLGGNGYYKLPGGLMVQWGNHTNAAPTDSVTFPTTFTAAVYSIGATCTSNGGINIVAVDTSSPPTTSGASFRTWTFSAGANLNYNWWAIGV